MSRHNAIDIINSRFTLSYTETNIEEKPTPNKILHYVSNDVFHYDATRKQIYDYYKNDIDALHNHFQNSVVEDKPVKNFKYFLTVDDGTGEPDETDGIWELESYQKIIYIVKFNDDNEITTEKKFYLIKKNSRKSALQSSYNNRIICFSRRKFTARRFTRRSFNRRIF